MNGLPVLRVNVPPVLQIYALAIGSPHAHARNFFNEGQAPAIFVPQLLEHEHHEGPSTPRVCEPTLCGRVMKQRNYKRLERLERLERLVLNFVCKRTQ